MNNFDWVTARDDCSTSERFFLLCANIKKDVDARNTLSDNTAYACQRTEDSLTVIRTEDKQSVTFSLETHQIIVKGYRIQPPRQDMVQRVFVSRLDGNGNCYFVEVNGVNDEPRKTIRESTLDALFFDSHSDRPRFP